jgi:hypothetical protein
VASVQHFIGGQDIIALELEAMAYCIDPYFSGENREGQVRPGHHGLDAWIVLGLAGVYRHDTGMGMRTPNDLSM